jgi:hypothetical protein
MSNFGKASARIFARESSSCSFEHRSIVNFLFFWRAECRPLMVTLTVTPKVAAADDGMGARPNEDSIETKLEGRLLKGTFSLRQIISPTSMEKIGA